MYKGDAALKILIITVAGMSTRFSESLGYTCLKCLYHQNSIEESLLYKILHHNVKFDYYVVVGGFMFEELSSVIAKYFQEFEDKIFLIQNTHYQDYASGYSLYLGLEQVQGMDFDEIVFAEGDLYVDEESFQRIYNTHNNVITCNQEPIFANNAVAFYLDINDGIHYIYDTNHLALEIKEPFIGILNSGQVWKFTDPERLRQAITDVTKQEWQGTNLALIQKYFGGICKKDYEVVTFREWVNCNTISDYEKIKELSRNNS